MSESSTFVDLTKFADLLDR